MAEQMDAGSSGLRRGWRHAAGMRDWPRMQDVIGHERAHRFGEGVKYGMRLLVSRPSRNEFMGQLTELQEWHALFQREPAHYFIPLRSYLDRRWGVHQRFAACAQDLATAHATFEARRCARLRLGEELLLCGTADFSVHLRKNQVCTHEGFWALTLSDAQGQALFNLSFGFLNCSEVLIASIQGLRKDSTDAQDSIRTLTKRAHGLRPAALLLDVFQLLCRHWRIRRTLAIDPDHQIKQHKRSGGKGFTFDYRGLWSDAGATLRADGYWLLPERLRERPASEIPSHKRSMYARRYALREALAGQIAQEWDGDAVASSELWMSKGLLLV